jgi:LmbE family N-acetylglucosaminyl deacetylase
MNRVLVVAVHPDDETLGCGGTLLKHRAAGDEIHWLICTEMAESHGFSEAAIAKRNAEIASVAALYRFDTVHRLGLPPARVDECRSGDVIGRIANVLNVIKADTLYLPFKADVHSDHRRIFEAAYSCTKSFRYPFIKRVLMMETPSETEFAPALNEGAFIPNAFVDISSYFEQKLSIMKIYAGEMAEHPFPRSERNLRALATWRGAVAGCEYAESFMLLKEMR